MNKRVSSHRRPWVVVVLAGLLVTAGIGLGRIEPAGTKTGLIQFDAIIELNMDKGCANWVVFARYWVCQDYYAASVIWSEPHGSGFINMQAAVVLSDGTTFRTHNAKFPDWVPANTTYAKPLGERVPFQWGGGMYEDSEMRFAEAQAVSRRVYASDLAGLKDPGQEMGQPVDVNVREVVNGAPRKLAQLKVRTKDDKIQSMELFDKQHRQLCGIEYDYEQRSDAAKLSRLTAELPVRPDKLGINTNVTLMRGADRPDTKTIHVVKDVNYVSHKGGRSCTVTYKDVTLDDQTLRLPVRVEVRNSEDKRLMRSARLLNFKHVDLDKAAVWEAAKTFADYSNEAQAWRPLGSKYLNPSPKRAPVQVDPNDLAFARRLIAKYPVPELKMPGSPARESSSATQTQSRDPIERQGLAREEADARRRELEEWKRRNANTPKPPRIEIAPNDVRVIRQLCRLYRDMLMPLSEEQSRQLRTEGGQVVRSIPENEREISDLRDKLNEILKYHRIPTLPEDGPPPMDPNDRETIRRLQKYYETRATQKDRGLGGELEAVHALTRLDRMLKDYDAFEAHTIRYLQMLQDGGLPAMYMVGGCANIQTLAEAGQHEKANKLLRQWADKSAADNDPDAVYRFVSGDLDARANPWACVQLLDRFLKKSGPTPTQRYEGLALRALALGKIDKFLADPKTAEQAGRKAQAQWILSMTSRDALARRVEPALREALAAWQSLGSARLTEARPYSTSRMGATTQNLVDYPDATRLQETSALLDQAIRERTGQTRSGRPAPRR
jgi:hypothetical protein